MRIHQIRPCLFVREAVGLRTLKNVISFVECMHDSNDTNTNSNNKHHHAEDNYYAGYYFSNNPYSSEEQLPGRRTDEELRTLILSQLKKIPDADASQVAVNVVDQIVSLTGSVKSYEDKRRVGEEIWKIEGVVRVLNELHVIEPTTAGPTRRD